MMNFFEQIGKVAIGSRVRMLSEQITTDAAQIYKMYDIDFQPKWFPVFYALSRGEQKSITGIAKEIGHSHPSVSKIIDEMAEKGLVNEQSDKADGRRNVVSLSAKGIEISHKIKDQYADVAGAVEGIAAQSQHDLWKALGEWEFLLEQKSLLRRVQEHRKIRESKSVRIVAYSPQYEQVFKILNEAWISKYFVMEVEDHEALSHAQENILDKGGFIFVALYRDEPVGVCALKKMDDPKYQYELAKMAVDPKAQGKNIGWLLARAVIEQATSMSAEYLYIESNTLLKPAINLYYKLGFKKVTGRPTPYERCNIQMELKLR